MSEIQNAINLNRLNLGENSIQNIQRMNDSLKSSKSNSTFEEALQKEVNESIQGRVSTSSIRLPQNIKAEVAADPYRKKLFDASVEFESIFVKMMLSQMKKSVEKSGLIDGGHAEEIFDDMLYDEYAKNISKTESLGIAEEIYKSLSKSLPKVDLKG
ncbi:MAG: rod-binding protein [Leptospiraceae bacterium]|jgi:flagellar protein FlgJ|nr:rod-binding protein [Leptospiraceae bacterium]MBK7056598.1 rod-binding protein [Leptospiraceae bacterium]MBK9501050.1 rod-binding protein [Leptospiraceae bacterium]MBL0264063.1 rod-binding protein [Leptospiraceae bacterium]MBP9889594.1 rod-binding protein [Leptospiraceae bacterium]